ncbi:MAG: glycosyltransferase family 39 protein [Anaerolineaceae bacterium]|nr:glycosyltransferase family 39 protein [Anaerolineaceae bacterium]
MADIFSEKPTYLKKTSFTGSTYRSRALISKRWLVLALPLAVFMVALLPRILNLDAFITADEDDQIMFATHFLKSVLRGDFGGALILGYPGVPTLILGAIGVAARYLAHYLGWLPLPWITADFMTTLDQVTTRFGVFEYPMDFLVWVRVPMAIAAALSILGIYLLVKRLLDRRIALLATLILAFDPFILAHSRVIHVDAPMSYFMFLSFLAFLLFLKQDSWRWLLLSGVFGGLAGLSKTPAAILGPILVVSGVLYALFPPEGVDRARLWKKLIIALVAWGGIAVVAIFAIWPSMWTQPVTAITMLVENVSSVNEISHPTTGIFWGGNQTDQSPLYYLIVFPYHLTPLTTIGFVGGLAMIAAGLLAYRARKSWVTDVLPIALGLLAYIIIFMAPVSTISRRGDRYILPVFFAVGLLSALALWWLAGLIVKHLPAALNGLKLTPMRLVAAATVIQIFFVLWYHPYYLAYFNPLLDGSDTAPKTINVGWGEGLDLAARYLNENVDTHEAVVASWYSNQFAPYYHGQTIDLSSQEAAITADYTVFYINQVQRGFPSAEILNYFRQIKPIHVVEIHGIEYAWIYKGPVIGASPQDDFNIPVEALLGGKARLYGVNVDGRPAPVDAYVAHKDQPGERYLGYKEVNGGLPVTLYWETLGPINTNHGKTNIYISLVDDRGNVWGKLDRIILAGLWRTNRWHPGFYIRDEYKLPIDAATPPGTYHLEVGLYDFETGNSLGVVKDIGEVTLTPPETFAQTDTLNINSLVSLPIDDQLTLVGHTFEQAELSPGAEIAAKIFWQADQAIGRNYQLEFSFLDTDRKKYIIAEEPLSAAYQPSEWRPTEIVGEAYRFRVPAVAPPGNYPLLVTVIDADTGQEIAHTTLTEVKIKAQHRNFTLPADVIPISAYINDEIELVGYRLDDQTLKGRQPFGLTLYWRSLDFAASNYTVFIHAAGPDQSIRGQWDSVPVQGTSPTSGWIPGEIIEDHYEVLMGRDVPAWKYDIFVGMYDPVTGERLPVSSARAPISENRIWLTRLPAVDN